MPGTSGGLGSNGISEGSASEGSAGSSGAPGSRGGVAGMGGAGIWRKEVVLAMMRGCLFGTVRREIHGWAGRRLLDDPPS